MSFSVFMDPSWTVRSDLLGSPASWSPKLFSNGSLLSVPVKGGSREERSTGWLLHCGAFHRDFFCTHDFPATYLPTNQPTAFLLLGAL